MPYFFNIGYYKFKSEEGNFCGIHRLKIQKIKSDPPVF
jgi:hypothetical protein